MKSHYDFSNAEKRKLHRPAAKLSIPVYLDEDIQRKLVGKNKKAPRDLSKIVNEILRHEIGVAEMLK